ncbi:protease inhibitor Inh/omp19 family protein [Pseudomonas sp. B2M1-30]|uniref:Protease inhibitor Inh/omp19 family protein n=1 Tax=Pseudomonas koreensis TaxID=198620 RepID=A0A9X3B1R7_9PSED|nr:MULTISPECIES: AprI/Inh family metalloprotease inhibitor [Pseudomonas]MBV4474814.1 protease inhibitor Inh/omp19 family protein [Pseudomonas botevensis]MCU0117834.1 protease inhibitor Inh/omp19 family protein [Pseudomonas sp. B2M1-30]MCU7247412.1 protease inhibitor Inh/omp19 family protein [Pseudomonas koreensis]MCU7259370.1 protease inhibitor Inh/omp19 family protein [Pseudomonas koreensis]
MIEKAFTRMAATFLLPMLMISGETTMASSLRLEDPSAFAGHWHATLTAPTDAADAQALQDKPSNTCQIDLEPDQTLGKGADCLGAWLEQTPIGWFPDPDGLSITGKEGSRIQFFSRQRDGLYLSTLKSGLVITLKRAAQQP